MRTCARRDTARLGGRGRGHEADMRVTIASAGSKVIGSISTMSRAVACQRAGGASRSRMPMPSAKKIRSHLAAFGGLGVADVVLEAQRAVGRDVGMPPGGGVIADTAGSTCRGASCAGSWRRPLRGCDRHGRKYAEPSTGRQFRAAEFLNPLGCPRPLSRLKPAGRPGTVPLVLPIPRLSGVVEIQVDWAAEQNDAPLAGFRGEAATAQQFSTPRSGEGHVARTHPQSECQTLG